MVSKTGVVLSIDLAHKHYRDLGMVYIPARGRKVRVLKPESLGLSGSPKPKTLASALASFCDDEGVRALLLDGPQGWRFPDSQIEHMRLSERVLNTPGKTGNPGSVKPRTYLGYIQFSIDLFSSLRLDHGWELLTRDWPERAETRWLIESFPSAAWRTLGLNKLPAKSKTTTAQLEAWSRDLELITGMNLPPQLTHDELQAAVVLPVGRAIVKNQPGKVLLSGADPIITNQGIVLEGWIPCPLNR
ncbi:MAG: DUF429 domain-containing protein [Anaerolineales bacterium]|nr:DUF429 domain-containing protein [Anaerolineales bacterium]